MEKLLKALTAFLSKEKIKYAAIGGFAVLIYGEPRMTVDLDINIILDRKMISKFLSKAKRHGLLPLLSNTKKIAEKSGVIPLRFEKGKGGWRVDFILAENILEYVAIERAKSIKVAGVKLNVVSPEDLIIHKMASPRPRDREDLKGILLRQKGKLDIGYIQNMLKKIDKSNKTHLRTQFRDLTTVANA